MTRRQWITVTACNNDNHITKISVITIPTIIATLDRHVFAAAKAQGGERKKKGGTSSGRRIFARLEEKREDRGESSVLSRRPDFSPAILTISRPGTAAGGCRRITIQSRESARLQVRFHAGTPVCGGTFIYLHKRRTVYTFPVRKSCMPAAVIYFFSFLARGNPP